MANNRLAFEGLDELRAALRALPEELTGEASHIIESAVNGASVAVRQGYASHRRTGNMQDHVTATFERSGRYAAGAVLKSASRHAHLFENGTQARHTHLGANRGSMPPGHVFIPAVVRVRRAMYAALKDLVTRKGLLVSGDA